jgi:hypothetical protein
VTSQAFQQSTTFRYEWTSHVLALGLVTGIGTCPFIRKQSIVTVALYYTVLLFCGSADEFLSS